ncbi:protein of unknown function [Modestobacter italicus]|uniref:Uncharacterized protein n=1 Tax=Modestobacter italicus (strain DSM 44449 / CECT 9708 / BC 501) TaxID=2732864 RepID=I4F4K7_MODI5|nr:protein of unknown function [Modestobacter marinus]
MRSLRGCRLLHPGECADCGVGSPPAPPVVGNPAVMNVDPAAELVGAVEDAAAETEAAWAGAEVAPVPQRGDGRAQEFSGFDDGEQFGLMAGGAVGHGGGLRIRSTGVA